MRPAMKYAYLKYSKTLRLMAKLAASQRLRCAPSERSMRPPIHQSERVEKMRMATKCATRFPVEKQTRQKQVGIAHPHAFLRKRHARKHDQHERPERGIQKREGLGQGLNHCFGRASTALFKDGSFCAWAYACIHASKRTDAMA